VGIEASSFREGLVHESILAMEILLADGRVVSATPTNEHKDLFFGIPNSYGTLGYVLKVRAKVIPAKKYVHLQYTKYTDAVQFFHDLDITCKDTHAPYVDGVIFGKNEMVLITGTFTDDAPYTHDYTFMNIFYKSIKHRSEDYLTTHDYIRRWDTDWFWCSKNFGMEHPLLRFLMGRTRLHSVTYQKIMRWNNRTKFSQRYIQPLARTHSESVIQDICIPVSNAPAFLDFLLKEIRILPIWTCPTRSPDASKVFPLFPSDHSELQIDFGFWDFVKTKESFPPGHFNTLIEQKTMELRGLKSLYSQSFYDKETFWRIYNHSAYIALKNAYDPGRRLKDLYEKCVLRS
jgi:FAD/FMN-containing dehydrogenase